MRKSSTQQAFLAAHQEAFRYFGGVFHQLRYDNLSSAVKKVLCGRRREETDRFIAFRSHWQFDASFCTPGKGHEKGGVEGEAGFFRRNHLAEIKRSEFSTRPLPALTAYDQLLSQSAQSFVKEVAQ
jgi:transposase